MATQSGAASGSLAPAGDTGGEEAFKLFLTEVKAAGRAGKVEKEGPELKPFPQNSAQRLHSLFRKARLQPEA
ncbi:hypothetical protein chiPu_0023960 [Chiloscyllium punctatum]|uniref:Uncharacterized protein n=1 Tax=Chiloscyllium punctatum TaxID=137246 RepID=A0A401TC08_CHIPU|nr:hypothetical protein [Chiloscyllium punctatum]